MEPQTVIARRIARELSDGMLINLGIGIPTLVANYVPAGMHVYFQSENGLIGTGAVPDEGMAHPTLTDAGGKPVTALPGASTFDSAMSFGLIRGGHLDLTVLGGLQVDQAGQLANWTIPNKMVPGMGGAMDLVSGARRVAKELRAGDLVNLGIGIPTLVANYVPPELKVFFQSENGLIGTGPIPEQGLAHPLLTDAGGRPISALPGASTFDSAMSFGFIRGGHVDVTVLGGLQVDSHGHLANWMIPGKMVPGMGGAMDLVSGAKRVIVAMQHAAKGKSKIVAKCSLPLTSARPVNLVVTDMAVIAFPDGTATLLETAPGVSIAEVMAVTEAELVIPNAVPEMQI